VSWHHLQELSNFCESFNKHKDHRPLCLNAVVGLCQRKLGKGAIDAMFYDIRCPSSASSCASQQPDLAGLGYLPPFLFSLVLTAGLTCGLRFHGQGCIKVSPGQLFSIQLYGVLNQWYLILFPRCGCPHAGRMVFSQLPETLFVGICHAVIKHNGENLGRPKNDTLMWLWVVAGGHCEEEGGGYQVLADPCRGASGVVQAVWPLPQPPPEHRIGVLDLSWGGARGPWPARRRYRPLLLDISV
jgi:hypothetical protein